MTPREIHNVTTQKCTGNTETTTEWKKLREELNKGSHITSGTQLIIIIFF